MRMRHLTFQIANVTSAMVWVPFMLLPGYFFARSIGVSGSKPVILGVGADRNTFERFYAGFNREVGVEPNLTVRLIAPSQCPAVDLNGAGAKSDAPPPKIELDVSLTVNVAKPATLLLILPAVPLKYGKVMLYPAKSSVPLLSVRPPVPKAKVLPSCTVPPLIVVPPL